jgi:hypothetical protein
MKQFVIGELPRPVPKDYLGQLDFVLLPCRSGEGTKPFVISPAEFSLASRLCTRGGYNFEEDVGTTRTTARVFAEALEKGLSQEDMSEHSRTRMTALLGFCRTAGCNGWTMVRRWKRAR